MNKTNPIFEALNELNENYAAEAVNSGKKKMKKPLKIALIAVAATLALGTTAVAASSGDRPVFKLNHKEMIADYDEYVNADGWTLKTLTAFQPFENMIAYHPVGRIRAYYENGDFIFYDEIGVDVLDIAEDANLFGTAFKGDESDMMLKNANGSGYIKGRGGIDANYNVVDFEEWIDPIEYVKYKANMAAYNRMPLEKKVYYLNLYGYNEFDDYGGIRHPSAEEVRKPDGHVYFNGRIYEPGFPSKDDDDQKHYQSYNSYYFPAVPGDVYGLFGFKPVTGGNLTDDIKGFYALLYYDEDSKEFTQGLYQYSLNDPVSGTPVDFTAWHYSELKDTFTDHYGFDYEYIELNNGTQARLHRSIMGDYIAEFEHDGSAYAFKTSLDRDNVTRILTDLGVING